MSTKQITDTTFDQEVLKSNQPVLVDFWAEWCGPCRALGPKLEELSNELGTKVRIVKVNVDENPNIAAKFGIRSIPTMILFKGGQTVETMMGNQPKEAIAQTLARHI
jgi:thioredoxin 1